MLEEYLEWIQRNESIFPIDSLHDKKKVLRTKDRDEREEKEKKNE